MALPTHVIVEMRLAFKSCAQQHRSWTVRSFSSTTIRPKKNNPSDKPAWPYDGSLPARKPFPNTDSRERAGNQGHDQTDLVPQERKKTAVGTDRRIPVPMRVIPKGRISQDVHLTPRQRLHVEMMTRRLPVQKEKKLFRPRLQIYHMGSFKEVCLAALKVTSIAAACLVNFVICPAHFAAGTAPWIIAMIWLGGFVPGTVIQYTTGSWVNRVFLDLPEKARESPKAAMEYAKNLPTDVVLDIRYLKPWGLEGSVKATMEELVPATQGNFLRPLTFRWRDDLLQKRRSSRIVPTSFYVDRVSATGEGSKNTIPGIWQAVYKQITKQPEKESPWPSHLEPYKT